MSTYYSKPRSILIVEDNEDDYEAVMRAFKKVGLDNPVSLCKNGREAMDFLKGEGAFLGNARPELPSLILLDLNMPGLGGRRVLQMIKEDADLKSIPVIILTTSSNERDVQACYQSGANAYLQKPVTFEGLMEAARSLKDFWLEKALLPDENKYA